MRIAALLAGEDRLRSSAGGIPSQCVAAIRMLEDEKRGLSHRRGGVTRLHGRAGRDQASRSSATTDAWSRT